MVLVYPSPVFSPIAFAFFQRASLRAGSRPRPLIMQGISCKETRFCDCSCQPAAAMTALARGTSIIEATVEQGLVVTSDGNSGCTFGLAPYPSLLGQRRPVCSVYCMTEWASYPSSGGKVVGNTSEDRAPYIRGCGEDTKTT